MPVLNNPKGLGRGVPMYTHSLRVCFRSHVKGASLLPLTGHKSLLRSATQNFIQKPNNTFYSTWESNPRPLAQQSRIVLLGQRGSNNKTDLGFTNVLHNYDFLTHPCTRSTSVLIAS